MGFLKVLPVMALHCLFLSAVLNTATAANDLLGASSLDGNRRELAAKKAKMHPPPSPAKKLPAKKRNKPVPDNLRDTADSLGSIINIFTEPDLLSGALGFDKVGAGTSCYDPAAFPYMHPAFMGVSYTVLSTLLVLETGECAHFCLGDCIFPIASF